MSQIVKSAVKSEPKNSIRGFLNAPILLSIRNNDQVQIFRRLMQIGFLILVLVIGAQFTLFVHQLETGGSVTVARPPGVEGFLPISALISLKYWVLTGIFNTIHPSALVILLIIATIAILLKKSFCSWICPVGLLSEILASLHKFVFRRTFRVNRWLDYPLRGIKYFLLFFFVSVIFLNMDVPQLEKFIYSPYNHVADIKMLKFFADLSEFSLWVITILFFLSIIVPYFWCRYLCPYGALLGSMSIFSVFKIRRNEASCTDCAKCSKVCPSSIGVHSVLKVSSDECHACLKCVDVCPAEKTLNFSTAFGAKQLTGRNIALTIIAVFLIGTFIARLTGRWQNSITTEQYQQYIDQLHDPKYDHNRGEVPDY